MRRYTVTFQVNGADTPVEDQVIVAGGRAEEPKAPVKVGYSFGGWYTRTLVSTLPEVGADQYIETVKEGDTVVG